MPVMCSGCLGFFAKSKARRQLLCPASGTNIVHSIESVESCKVVESFCEEFKELLNSLLLDVTGNYIKTEKIVLMIGARSFGALRRKKDKKIGAKKLVRTRMQLVARVYLCFREIYSNQTEVKLTDLLDNAADMYRRETLLEY